MVKTTKKAEGEKHKGIKWLTLLPGSPPATAHPSPSGIMRYRSAF